MKVNREYNIINKENCRKKEVKMKKSIDIIKILKESNRYFEDFISRSPYHSNAIEGNTFSFAETYALLFDNKLGYVL